MTRREKFARQVIEKGELKLTIKEIVKIFDAAWEVAGETLLTGEDVVLGKMGKLAAVRRKARQGRNPKTGEAVSIPEHNAAKFVSFKATRRILGD